MVPFAMAVSLIAGHTVEHSYEAKYIVLSYLVSIVGCWTALELLHRKTSSLGIYNWSVAL